MNRLDINKEMENIGYRINDLGSIIDSKNQEISNIVINPIEQVRKHINGKEVMYATFTARVSNGEEVKICLSVQDITKLQWIPCKLGMHAIVANGKKTEFLTIIKKLFTKVRIIESYDSTGWQKGINGELVYLDAEGAVQEPNYEVEIDEHLMNYRFSRKIIDVKEACKYSLNLLNVVKRPVSYVLLSLIYLCPLLSFMNEKLKLPEFVVWIYGFTGTRKTTIAKLFASHFGNFNNKVTASFNDTYSSIELKAFKLKDSLMLLDDYCPQQSWKETQNINSIAEKVVRAYGDRTSRGRLTMTMESQTQFIPRGMALITGETIVPGNSTVARLIPIELKKDDVDLDKLTIAQDNAEALSVAMREYILWLTKNCNEEKKDFIDTLKYNYNYYYNYIKTNSIETHGRTYEAFSILLLSLDIMYQFHIDMGSISQEEADLEEEEAKTIFLELIKSKHELNRYDNPVEVFLDTIKNLITSNTITIRNLETNEVIGNKYKTESGYCDSQFYYFDLHTIYGLVRSKLAVAGVYLQLPEKGMVKALVNTGVLKVEKDNNMPKKTIKRADNTSVRIRLLHFKREYLE